MITFLVVLTIVLAVAALAQLLKVFEATARLKGAVAPTPTNSENRNQAAGMLLFVVAYFAFFIWLVIRYGPYLLPEPASEHGVLLDDLLNFNFLIITVVFAITHVFLFYFAFKYVSDGKRKAYYFTHSNKLEILWTTVPAIFLAVIVIYGLSAWIDITDDAPDGSLTIELYPKQFDWTARYSGQDSTLGASNYYFVNGTNPLGVVTKTTIATRQREINEDMAYIQEELTKVPAGGIKAEELSHLMEKRKRELAKIQSFESLSIAELESGKDDILVKTEFHIPVNQHVNFLFRSRDVIHSAYMPHFRAQMNCVPGMVTQFHFLPTITTEEMRQKTGNKDFNYTLLCNKICGAAHYNMKMTIVVDTPEDYAKWIAEQKNFAQVMMESEEGTALEESSTEETINLSMIVQ